MFPLAHTVQHLAYIEGARDSHGNPVDDWADPVAVDVYGWQTPQTSEPKVAGQESVVVDVELMAPKIVTADSRDKFVLAGRTYEVIGLPEDCTTGPFGWEPGVVINLRNAEG